MKSKLINKNGKLFDKIHLFDAILLIGLIVFLISIGKSRLNKSTWITAEIKLGTHEWWQDSLPPPDWLALSIKVGDKELDWKSSAIAEVVDIKIYDPGWDRKIVYATVKLKTQYDSKKNQHIFKNKILSVGNTLDLNLSQTKASGLIVYLEGVPDNREKVERTVTLRLYNRFPWYADAIRVSDTMKVNQETIAEILNKQTRIAEKSTITTGQNSNLEILNSDPNKRDITLKTRLVLTQDKDGALLFRDDQRIKIGNTIWIGLSNINLTRADIIDIQ